MTDFLSNAFTFPTIFYTGLLILVVLYWLTAIVGFTDFDGVNTEIEIDATDTSGIAGWLTRLRLNGIPFSLSLSFIIFFAWIICFFMVEFFVKNIESEGVRIAMGFWVIILAPAIAIPIVAILLAPLKPLFKKLSESAEAPSAKDYIGNIATIRSEKVNQSHGSVELSDGGAGLILQVRADEPNTYKRGDNVVLNQYLTATNTYLIRPAI